MSGRRIAILFEFSTLNGGERSMLAAIDSMQKASTQFTFVAIGPPVGRLADALQERMIPLFAWSQTDLLGHRLAPETIEASLCQIVMSIQPEIVHANSLAMGRLLGRISNRVKMRTTSHLRDIIKLSAAAVTELNSHQYLIAVSNATRDYHVSQGVRESLVCVVQNGVNLDQFRPRPRTGWLLRELRRRKDDSDSTKHDGGLNIAIDEQKRHWFSEPATNPNVSSATLIACIGQIGLRKGQDILAAAATNIIEHVPDAHFILIGERTSQKAESVAFEKQVYRRFADAQLSSRLHILGHREDIAELLSEIDLLVHPAHQEPYGRVLLEASAAAVPIVATDVGGTSEIVEDGVTGRLVPRNDPQALALAVNSLLTNPIELERMRTAARERAERDFAIEIAAKKLAAVWNDVGVKRK